MLRRISESLAGRAVYFVLHPFTRREIWGAIKRRPFLKTFFDSPRAPRTLGTVAPIKRMRSSPVECRPFAWAGEEPSFVVSRL
jgi:predicted AAA+ superfamily ATPase